MNLFQRAIRSIFPIKESEQRGISFKSFGTSDIVVSKDTAMTFTAVWAAVRLLSESVSSMPIDVYTRENNGDKIPATNSPVYNLLKSGVNENVSSVVFIEKVMKDLCLDGNSYAKIIRNGAARPEELELWSYEDVEIIQQNGKLFYSNSTKGEVVDSADVLHFKILTQNGIQGISPITQCAQAIEWGKQVEKFGSTFFQNGAKLSGVLQTDRQLSEQAVDRLRDSFNNVYSKLSNSNSTAILEEGLTFKPVSISAEQAQFLSSRYFSIAEVARIFGIAPHLLKDLSKSSFNNIEMQSQEFVTYTLMPYLKKIESEMNRKLFRKNEVGRAFVEFNANSLLRGNTKDRSEFYRTMLNIGVMTINEIRRKENMNSIVDGDKHFIQLNMTTIDKIGEDAG